MKACFNLFNSLSPLAGFVLTPAGFFSPPARARWRAAGFLVDIEHDPIPAGSIR
jgi:hypothetical protein